MYIFGNMGLVFCLGFVFLLVCCFLSESDSLIVNLINLLCHISCHTWKESTRRMVLLLNLDHGKC